METDNIEYKRPNVKSTSTKRWLILFLACIMMVGSYYSLDIPAATKNQLNAYMGGPDDYETNFQMLYTLYAAPNVLLPVFGGFLIDHFGVRLSLLLFVSIITVGQFIVAIGVSCKSWGIIYLGRLVFGLGGESFTVANTAFITDWFIGNELAFAFGFNLSFGRLGSVFNNIMSPYLVREFEYLPAAYWFGAILCVICLGIVLITIPLDSAMENSEDDSKGFVLNVLEDSSVHNLIYDRRETELVNIESTHGSSEIHRRKRSIDENEAEFQPAPTQECEKPLQAKISTIIATSSQDLMSFRIIFWVLGASCLLTYGVVYPFNNISSSLLLERDYFKDLSPEYSSCKLEKHGCESVTNIPIAANCPSSSTGYQPPLPYDVKVAGIYYAQVDNTDVDCTNDIWRGSSDTVGCTPNYCKQLAVAESRASYIMSIPYTISAVLSPPLGYFIDRYGWRAIISLAAPVILVIVHSTLAVSDEVSPVYPLIGQGLAFTGYVAVLWPCVPLVVEDRVLGLGYGIVTGLQNSGVAIIPLIVAAVFNNSNHQYLPNVEYLFICMGIVGTLVGIYMNYYDFNHGSVLNRGLQQEEKGFGDNRLDGVNDSSIEGNGGGEMLGNEKGYFQLRSLESANVNS